MRGGSTGGHELGILRWGLPEKWLLELGGRIVVMVRLGMTKEGNQDGHVGVALDVVQNLRIDGNEDPWTEHVGLVPETQEAVAGQGLDRNRNSRRMVGQERAAAALDKHQLAPATGQEGLDLAVPAV